MILQIQNGEIDVNGQVETWQSEEVILFILDSASDVGECPANLNRMDPKEIATRLLPNASFLHLHLPTKTCSVFREWPGDTQLFYSFDGRKVVVSNNISRLVDEKTGLSERGSKQFLEDRKHFHNNTIFKRIKVLHPGHFLQCSTSPANVELSWWYVPMKNMKNVSVAEASKRYRYGLEAYLDKRIPSKESYIALMFSGGSDSLYLLQTLTELGYSNIDLFVFAIAGAETQVELAQESASYFSKEINLVRIDPDDALDEWLKYIPQVYHCLSEIRLNGCAIFLDKTYREVLARSKGQKPFVLWGSQYSVISPTISTAGIFYLSGVYAMFKCLQVIRWESAQRRILESFLKRYPVFNEKISDPDILSVYLDNACHAFRKSKTPSAIVNYILLSNYNHLKHWWMGHRNIIAKNLNSSITNLYPYHDREYQEMIMEFPLKLRVGGLFNLCRMPDKYKSFFYSLLNGRIPKKCYSRGNSKTVSDFFLLLKSKKTYHFVRDFFNENSDLICRVFGPTEGFNLDYQEYLAASPLEIERFFGIIYICIKSREHSMPSNIYNKDH